MFKHFLDRIPTLLLMLLFISTSARGDIMDYYFHSLDIPQSSMSDFKQINQLLGNDSIDDAITLARQLLEENQDFRGSRTLLYGKLMANLGMILGLGGYHENSLATLNEALILLESTVSSFSPELLNVIMARALTLAELEQLKETEQALLRAQNISHRQEGVYSYSQIPIVEQLFEVQFQQGNFLKADQQQMFNLRINEQTFGYNSEELLPVLGKMGDYFAERARRFRFTQDNTIQNQELLFSRSQNLYNRAIDIIELQYGPNDLRLVEPLRRIAYLRFSQLYGSRMMSRMSNGMMFSQPVSSKPSKLAMERALNVVEGNSTTDLTDRIDAIIRLGDLYTLTSDKRAFETYLRAWNLLQENPEHENLSVALFGKPTLIGPGIPRVLYLEKRPRKVAPDENLFISARYTINANGRVGEVKVIDKNVSTNQFHRLRSQLSAIRFRPRIVDGTFVETENLTLHQTFRVARKRTSSNSSDNP